MKKFLTLVVLTSCAGLYAQGSPYQERPPQTNTQGQYGGGMNDQQLLLHIQSQLSSYKNRDRYGNVMASVNGGNVTLTGTVQTQDDKDALGGLVGGVNGVKSVNNQVTVQGSNSSQNYGGSSQGNTYKNTPLK